MKNAPILILDDALSAVDTDTEEHILHNLKKNRAGKTTIRGCQGRSTGQIKRKGGLLIYETFTRLFKTT